MRLKVWFGLCCLMAPGLSKEIHVMYDHNLSKLVNHQIRHQATHKVGCQCGDFHMVTLVFVCQVRFENVDLNEI